MSATQATMRAAAGGECLPLRAGYNCVWMEYFTPTYASPLKGEESVRGIGSPLKGEEVRAAQATMRAAAGGESVPLRAGYFLKSLREVRSRTGNARRGNLLWSATDRFVDCFDCLLDAALAMTSKNSLWIVSYL